MIRDNIRLTNKELIDQFISASMKIVGRRSTHDFAIETITITLDQLGQKYDFLKYITLKDDEFSKSKYVIIVDQEINNVETRDIIMYISDFFDIAVQRLGHRADHFFIRELSEEFGFRVEKTLRSYGLNLSLKQLEHLGDIREGTTIKISRLKNSEVVEPVLSGLVNYLNKGIAKEKSMKILKDSIGKYKAEYDFLMLISISDTPDHNGVYELQISNEIDDVLAAKVGEALQQIILEIGRYFGFKDRLFFVKNFKKEFSMKDISNMKKIGIDLYQVEKKMQQQGQELLVRKVFETLIEVCSKNNSKEFIVESIDLIFEQLKERHNDVLQFIQIDKSRYNEGIDAFIINSGINAVENIILGKAIKMVLKTAQGDLKNKVPGLIKNFENDFDDEYISELERIGVNLQILQMGTIT